MATIALRIDDDLRDQLAAQAAHEGVTLSQLLRQAVDDLLGRGTRGTRERRHEVPATLSLVERRLLILHHEVLAALEGADSLHHRSAEALYLGLAAEYEDEFAGLQPEMSRSEASLLWDILDFFTVVESSIHRLNAIDRGALGANRIGWLEFGGFDLADQREGSLLTYARYLIADNRWPNLSEHFDRDHEGGHSHHRMLPKYQTLMAAYEPMKRVRRGSFAPESALLTLDELVTLGDVKVDHAKWS